MMRRREFLRAGAGALAVAALPGLSSRALAEDTVEVTLRATTHRFSPFPGLVVAGLAYEGAIPGPLLRVVRGQRVRVKYRSSVAVPTSIHWHGMTLPNDMDGVGGITQPAVPYGGEYLYDFVPGPSGTRWYHDHAFNLAFGRGLFGMFVVDDASEEPSDKEFALVFHDVPQTGSMKTALRGLSDAPMTESMGGQNMQMPGRGMGDEVAYSAHCVNGAAFPNGKKLAVSVGDRVRLRLLNASPTQTRYVALAGHELSVTHADGNRLARPVTVDVVRIGAGERYDAFCEVRSPGAFALQSISTDPLESRQAVLLYTEGMVDAAPLRAPTTLGDLRVLSYELAGGVRAPSHSPQARPDFDLTLGGGGWGDNRWTIDGNVWPQTPKLRVARDDLITVRFRNTSEMDHPMHLHGHVFWVTEVGGKQLLQPLAKDTVLVPAGSSATLRFTADAPQGRWLLHCHNEIHMVDGMMMEVVYAG